MGQNTPIIQLIIEPCMKYIILSIILSLVLLQGACSVFLSQTESREVENFTGIERKASSFRAGMDSSDGEAVHLF